MTPPIVAGLTIRPLELSDWAAVQRVFDEDPAFFTEINGRAFTMEEIGAALPPGRTIHDKFLFAIEREGRVEGVIDLIRGYPEPHIMHLGLIFLSTRVRGGTGRRCLRALYDWARAMGATVLRLGVVEPNLKARHLYATEGFEYETTREADPEAKRMRRTLVLRRAL
jgi:RimJ/RimL family protein N-acetyltransferase